MKKIAACLWFENQAEEAAKFYTSVIKNSKMGNITHYSDEVAKASGGQAGSVMTVSFELNGYDFLGLNGGPQFKFTEAVSFMLKCDTQEEIDYLWEKLSEGGEKSVCGWLKDKFGLSWQVIHADFDKMMTGKDPEKEERAMNAVMQMKKLDIKKIRDAYDGK
ncbi:MAG: VOC family protein [Ignavibacteria bacterium]